MHLASISEMASRNDDINNPGRAGNGKEPPTGLDVRYDDMGILGLPWQGKIGHEASQCHRLRRCPMPHIARLDTDRAPPSSALATSAREGRQGWVGYLQGDSCPGDAMRCDAMRAGCCRCLLHVKRFEAPKAPPQKSSTLFWSMYSLAYQRTRDPPGHSTPYSQSIPTGLYLAPFYNPVTVG